MPRDFTPVTPVIGADTPGAIAYTYQGDRGQTLTGYRMPTEQERVTAEGIANLPPELQALVKSGVLVPNVQSQGNTRTGDNQTFTFEGLTRKVGDHDFENYDASGAYVGMSNDSGGALGSITQAAGAALPNILMAAGMTMMTGGLGNSIGSSLVNSGAVASTAAANAIGAAAVQAGVSIARGVPPDKALENAVVGVLTSQYISPAVAKEVKSVIDSPLGQQLATNAGTSLLVGGIKGQSIDQIEKSILGSSTGILANAAGQEVGQGMLDSIEDPELASIAAAAANAGTRALITGKDVGKAALDAGATAAVDPASDYLSSLDLGSDGDFSDYVRSLRDSAGAALQPISDAATAVLQPVSDVATQVLQPFEQPIKDIYQAGADTATKVLQPLEQPVKDAYQATADATTKVLQPLEQPVKDAYQATADKATEVLQPVEGAVKDAYQATADKATEVLQPVEGAIKDVAQAGSDAVTKAFDNLPTVDVSKITLPNLVTPVKQTPTAQAPTATAQALTTEDVRHNNIAGAGTGFDVSETFDPTWFSDYQKSHKPTKIASGGYLDRLLEQPTSFEDLLRTLRS